MASCISDQVSCAYSRTMLLADGRLRQLTLSLLDAQDEALVVSIVAPGQDLWSQQFDCAADTVQVETVVGLTTAGEPVSLDATFERERLNEKVCSSSVSSAILDAAVSSGARYVQLRRVTTVDKSQGVLTGIIDLPPASRNRHLVGSTGNATLYTDSTAMADKVLRGPLKDSVVIVEQEPRALPGNHWVLFSNQESWKQVALRYGKAEAALMGASAHLQRPAEDQGRPSVLADRVAATTRKVAGSVEYHLDWADAEGLPVRTPQEVFARGRGDCRDMAMALVAELRRQGVPAVSVLTSTRGGAPRSLVVPDMAWANHVVVYVPGLGSFIDLTADTGSERVTSNSVIWGGIGFRTDTGEIVVIQ